MVVLPVLLPEPPPPDAPPVALAPVLEPVFGPPALPIGLCAVVLVTPTGFDPLGLAADAGPAASMWPSARVAAAWSLAPPPARV